MNLQTITLESLLQDLEKQAGFPEDMKDKKDDKDDEDKKKDGDGDADDKKKDKKDDKDDAKDKKEDQEKSAAFKSGEQLAKEVLEKVASTKIEQNKGENMNKQAADTGKALAQSLLQKMAGVGDINTTNGVAPGVVPHKTIRDLAQQVLEHDDNFQATPGTDGAGNGGTINQIFDAIVADAASRGAVMDASTGPQAPAEGAANQQAPAQVPVAPPSAIGGDNQEKTAAVVALVNSGVDFDDAVNMVKAASDDLDREHETHVKQAALNELLDSGVDFDLAVALIKQIS